MNQLKKILKFVGKLPTWLLLIVFLASLSLSVYSLRSNNREMIRLRNTVYEADKTNSGINNALNNLRSYVYTHMNTNLSSGGNPIKPPIQLKYSYERLQTAEQQRVDAANSSVYTDAQSYCQALNPDSFSGRTRVPCVQDYVSVHGVEANKIPAELYQFDFVSPAWSPDLAGWSLAATGLLFMGLLASFSVDRMVRARVKSQQI
ncbi:hypothetical protein COU91_02650 [Candidatus Saccharibacteria bacterium CG10_big_fil_rev_8_21_14_0_10_47_8]|nr:MAG: hypothetical protein COU91_02650 [Candidatus Saccharibacteria bacterium CG10_big_fil_rev_8_21_14_0_10_47_8]